MPTFQKGRSEVIRGTPCTPFKKGRSEVIDGTPFKKGGQRSWMADHENREVRGHRWHTIQKENLEVMDGTPCRKGGQRSTKACQVEKGRPISERVINGTHLKEGGQGS